MSLEVPESIKCVVVGDGTVGKTCMLISYAKGEFPTRYVPTIFDNYTANVTIGDKTCQLQLFDTAGQEEFDKLRKLSYDDTDVFLICFSVVLPSSAANAEKLWIHEIRNANKKAAIILVGTKTDLRDKHEEIEKLAKSKLKPISTSDGEALASKLKVGKYVECSALTCNGLKNVFDEAILAIVNKNKKKTKGGCVLL